MRTPSGILHIVDFKTSQIVSNIQPKDYWDDKRHWEIKNNIDTLEFKTFNGTSHAITLQQQNLILKEVRDGRIIPYVINNEVEKDSNDKSLTVHASGAWVQIAKNGYIMPQRIESKTVNEFIDMALIGMKWKRGRTEYAGFHTMTVDEIIDPLTFLNKIASLFNLEIQYRVEVVGSQITGWYVDMIKRRGQETGKEVALGKDLVGVRRIEHSRDICTALVGFVKGEGDKIITVESINNGLPYITDSDAFQRWNEQGKHKFGFYTPETEDQNMSPERLMTLMKTEFKKRINTSVSYEVEAQSIGRVFGLAHELINEGDTIRIKDTGFTPKLYLEARAIAGDESFTDPSQDKYVFGDYRELVDQSEEWRRYYKQLVSQLGGKATQDYVDQLKLIAEKAEADAAQAIIDANLADRAAQKAKEDAEYAKALADQINKDSATWQTVIIESTNAPTTGLVAGKSLWLDISKGKPGILKKWNGTTWEAIVPDTKQLEQDVQTWVNGELDKIKDDMEDLVDINWLNQQMEGKANKADTYTKTDVDTALNGKVSNSKYTTDQQGVLQKFENQQTQINQNAKDITLSATKTELSTVDGKVTTVDGKLNTTNGKVAGLEGDMVNVKKEASELKVEVGKISTSVSEVTGKVDGMKFGAENMLLDVTQNNHPAWNQIGNTRTPVQFMNTDVWSSTAQWSGLEYRVYDIIERFPDILNKEVTFSCYARYAGATTEKVQLNFYLDGSNKSGTKVGELTKDWQRFNITFPWIAAINTNNKQMRFEPILAAAAGKSFEFAAYQLEEGNILSSFKKPTSDLTLNTEFVKKTSEIIQTVDGITQRVENTESGLTGVKSRVGTLETTSTGITARVTEIEKVNTAQGNTLTSQGQTITTHTSEIDVLKNQITLTVSKDEAQGYVSAAGRENIIKNAVLSSGKYWGFHAGVSHDPALNYKGYGVLKTVQSGLTADSWRGAYTDRYPCVGGNYYVASAWAYRTTAMDRGASYEIQFFDKAGTRIGTAYSSITDENLPINTWKKFQTDEYKAPDNAVSMFFRFHVVRNGTLMISQPTLQAGKIASTDFYPSPFDYTNQEQLISDVSNKVNTSDYNQKVTQIDNRLTINEQGLDLKASKSEVYTQTQSDGRYAKDAYVKELEGRVQVTEKNILSTVKKGDIISSINQTAEQITIDVSKLAINAATIVKWLTAEGIDTNFISVRGDKIIIDKNGVTVKMLDFLFEDEWGTKTTAVSRRNLIADPDFSSVTKKNIGNADYYGFEGGYGLTWKSWGNVVIEKNTHIFDYEQMVNAARVDMYNYPEAIVNNGIHPGNEYTVSAHFRAAMINGVRKTGKPRLQVCCVTFRDNVSYDTWHEQKMDFPEPSTYYGEIRRYSFTFKVPTNYIPQQHALIIKVCSGNADMRQGTAVCVSGVTLYSGKYASMYNWDRAAAERADGLQPFNKIAIGGVNNNIGPSDNGQTFDISTEKDVFINQPILTQGINLGRNRMGQAGSIRFFDGGQGYGFYFMGMAGQWYKLPNV
ncbi:phage tail spike protein [Bacillus cereus]|uniref:phage tail spike protein n=1 Tax=Bacillus cereus TaxID=1396 RepID=UPI0034D3A173